MEDRIEKRIELRASVSRVWRALTDYREFGSHRLMARGEGIWHAPAGDYSYLRFDLDAIEYNVTALHRPVGSTRS